MSIMLFNSLINKRSSKILYLIQKRLQRDSSRHLLEFTNKRKTGFFHSERGKENQLSLYWTKYIFMFIDNDLHCCQLSVIYRVVK